MLILTIGQVAKLFDKYSVCVTGSKGSGKDVFFGNVIAKRNKPYVSNLDYTIGKNYSPLDLSNLDMGCNSYNDFIIGTIKPYHHCYPKGADIYISDVGVYFPSQYCGELNKKYPYIATYEALSRQVSRNAVHINTQNFNRAYDKLREMCDLYIRCQFCKVLFGKICVQKFIIYTKAESCQARVRPCKVHVPLLGSAEARIQAQIYRDKFYNQYGHVISCLMITPLKSKHDTYYFEKLLEVTYPNEENSQRN